jgi:hypothetical protein
MSYTTVTRLLNNQAAITGEPTTVAFGVAVPTAGNTREGTVSVYSIAGSGAMSVTIRLWGYVENSIGTGRWLPLGIGTAELKGVMNGGAAIDETTILGVGTERIRHAEPLALPGHFDRLYAQVVAISGVLTAVCVDLITGRYQ